MKRPIAFFGVCCLAFAPSIFASPPEPEAAIAAAKSAHEALEAGRVDDFLALLHEEDAAQVSTMLLKLWQLRKDSNDSAMTEFEKTRSPAEFAQSKPKDFLRAWLKSAHVKVPPDLRTSFSSVGVVSRGDIAYVVSREGRRLNFTKAYRTADGTTTVGATSKYSARIRVDLMEAKWLAAGLSGDEIAERAKADVVGISVIGVLRNESGELGIVSEVTAVIDGEEIKDVSASRLSEDDPIRDLLDPTDPTKMDDARRARIEAAMMEE
jgi:hypothetical protein